MPLINPQPLNIGSGVDLTAYNLTHQSQNWKSRQGLITALSPTASRTIASVSRHTSNSGRVYYYLLEYDANYTLFCKIYNKDLVQIGNTVNLATQASDPTQPIYWAQNAYNKIIITGYGLTPLTAEVGSSPRRAQAAPPAQANPDTPPLPIARGPSTRFGDRIAVAENNIVYLQYPDVSPEVYTASGIVAVAGQITNIIQSVSGDLRIITADNQTIADQAGLVEEAFDGRTVSNGQYKSSRQQTAVSTTLGDFGLYKQGIINLANGQYMHLLNVNTTHQDTPANIHRNTDWRDVGRIWAWSRGVIITVGINAICVVDLTTGHHSWWDDTAITTDLVNIIEAEDNQLFFVSRSSVLATWDDAPDCNCAISIRLPHNPLIQNSVSAIAVVTLGDAVQPVKTRVRNSLRTTTPGASPSSSLIGTAVWDTAVAQITEPSTAEHNHDKRGNNLSIEVVIGRNTELIAVAIDDKVDQGKTRRRQV
jgi:hypothetical protein